MQSVKENDLITILYDGLADTGELFDSGKESGPLQFTVGDGTVLPAFERLVVGMCEGETRTVSVGAKEAYGLRNEELVMTLPRSTFADKPIKPGMILGMKMDKDGQEHTVPASVVAVDKESVTVDFNHPLAGQDITYRITLLSIDSPAPAGGCGCGG